MMQQLSTTTAEQTPRSPPIAAAGPQSTELLSTPSGVRAHTIWDRHQGVFIALLAISAVCLGAIGYFVRISSLSSSNVAVRLHTVLRHLAATPQCKQHTHTHVCRCTRFAA